MAVLERSELQASPLADLHAIADQLGVDGYRRLRKPELIDTILAKGAPAPDGERSWSGGEGLAGQDSEELSGQDSEELPGQDSERTVAPRRRRRTARSTSARPRRAQATAGADGTVEDAAPKRERAEPADRQRERGGDLVEGVVELLGNGSAFLRVSPPEPSDEDVYISAAQVRRCELVSGDRVSGPVRTPRRSERYPSLVRIETINGSSAEAVGGTRYDELPLAYPSERLVFAAQDATLEAIEWLTPIGRGSRALIVGAARAGKTETLRRLLAAISAAGGLEVSVVLAGARPEEIAEWQEGAIAPVAALNFAASADSQGQAVERAVDAAKRVATRGGDALVLIDGLDGLHPHAARKALAAARNLRDAGSLTVIGTATRPFGGETTVIALDVALTSTGREPILDLLGSGTLRPELLVGEDGARAITQARAASLEAAG